QQTGQHHQTKSNFTRIGVSLANWNVGDDTWNALAVSTLFRPVAVEWFGLVGAIEKSFLLELAHQRHIGEHLGRRVFKPRVWRRKTRLTISGRVFCVGLVAR